jgi:glycosyltransferase involved in cell wall biosynthesis
VSLLFIANLTYAPNVEAASLLVEAILPRIQTRLARRVRVTLVGHHHDELSRLARPHVELAGFVADLQPFYEAADVVVVPHAVGGGTRIKLLEAFAHRVPVVASPVAAAGLAVSDGCHLLLAEDPDQAAASIEALVTRPAVAQALVEEAWTLVRGRYCTDAVVPGLRRFLAHAPMVGCR